MSRGGARAALRGMDGRAQLVAALDEVRRHAGTEDVVVVDNGGRGPNIIDSRGLAGDWLIEGVIPSGVIAALTDLDDPSPATLLENGFDVVIQLGTRGAPVVGEDVLQRIYFAPRLHLAPVEPFNIRYDGAAWVRG